MGNICRSPTAEGVFRQRVEQAGLGSRIEIDSAGTGDWHVGKAPDSRACAAAGKRGYRLTALRARQVQPEDFLRFDLILAMDHDNLARLEALRPEASRAELDLLLRRYAATTWRVAWCQTLTTARQMASRKYWISSRRPVMRCSWN